MYLRFLSKFIFLVVIVVVYAILAYSKILPKAINVFELSITQPINKSIVVKEVRDIGELTSAQFYGEVFSDLNSVQASIVDRYPNGNIPDTLQEQFPKIGAFARIYLAYKVVDSVYRAHQIRIVELTQLIDTLKQNYNVNSDRFISEKGRLKAVEEIELKTDELQSLRSNVKKLEKQARIARSDLDTFKKQRNLIYIGRGKVRAGFDFLQIIEKYIGIENTSDSVLIFLPQPVILNADINPWYLKDKIKGYELFDEYGGPFTEDEIKGVRLKCLDELKQQALDKGILRYASVNGQKTFENLFTALGYSTIKVQFIQRDTVK